MYDLNYYHKDIIITKIFTNIKIYYKIDKVSFYNFIGNLNRTVKKSNTNDIEKTYFIGEAQDRPCQSCKELEQLSISVSHFLAYRLITLGINDSLKL